MSQIEEPLWLVKSGGRLIGPYPFAKIVELLRHREVVLLDEVCLPRKRWRYIRDESIFKKVIEELRDLEISDDETATVGTSKADITLSISKPMFEESHHNSQEEVNESLNISGDRSDEVLIEDIEEKIEVFSAENHSYIKGQRENQFVQKEDVEVELKGFSQKVWKIAFVFVILFSISIFVRQKFLKKTVPHHSQDFSEAARQFLLLGQRDEALRNFDKAYEQDPQNLEIYEPLGLLWIQVEKQTARARSLFAALESKHILPLTQTQSGIALSYMFDNDFSTAEQIWNRLIQMQPSNNKQRLNLGTTYYFEGKYQQALEIYLGLRREGYFKPHLNMMLALTYLKMANGVRTADLDKAEALLKQILDNNFEYLQEAYLLLAYVAQIKNHREEVLNYVEKALSIDPQLTRDFKKNMELYLDHLEMGSLITYCNSLPLDNGAVKVFNSYCLLRAKQEPESEQRIKEALAQNPQSILGQSIYSLIFSSMGMSDRASVALGRAQEMNRENKYILPLILQAKFCQTSKDYDCAEEYFLKVLEKNPASLSAVVHLSLVRAEKSNWANINSVIGTYSQKTPNYIPLLVLENKYESSKVK